MTYQFLSSQFHVEILAPIVDYVFHAEMSVVFYDMTTIRAEGPSEQDDDVRKLGMSKDGGIARHFTLGLAQSAEVIPLYHDVFEGNTAEVGTLKASLQKVMARFPIQQVITDCLPESVRTS